MNHSLWTRICGHLKMARLFVAIVSIARVSVGAEPSWWTDRGVKSDAAASDFAIANQGQAKWMALQAETELRSRLPDGYNGPILTAPLGDNFASINQGQLKNLAQPFYDRIHAAALAFPNKNILRWLPSSVTGSYPWTDSPLDDKNFAPVNIGQLKYVFSFCFDCSVIASRPLDQTVCPGTPASFSVVAADPTVIYQWRKDGANLSDTGNITGSQSATLTIASAGADDAGSYDCIVTDASGPWYSEPATLSLNAQVNIATPPMDQSDCEGHAITLSISASGDGLTYQWRKDGIEIDGATASTLRLPGLVSDSGAYDCVVSGLCGDSQISAIANVVVTPTVQPRTADPWWRAWWRGEGNALDEAGNGDGIPHNVTYPLGEVDHCFSFNGTDAYIDLPNLPISGNFTVEGWVKYDHLNAQGNTIIEKGLNADGYMDWSISVGTGGNLIATIRASPVTAYPPVYQTYQCYSVTTLIPNEWNFISVVFIFNGAQQYLWVRVNDGTPGTLLFSPTVTLANTSPGGRIGCYLSSYGFFAGQIDELSVYSWGMPPTWLDPIEAAGCAGKQAITVVPASQAVCNGSAATFSVRDLSSFPPIGYQWRKDGVALAGQTASSLTIPAAGTADVGSYDCVVTREEGSRLTTAGTLSLDTCVTLPYGSQAWWRGENNALDSYGMFNGTEHNVQYGPGEVGQGFIFTGSDSYVEVLSDIGPALSGDFSVVAWVNYTPNTHADIFGTVVSKGSAWNLTIDPNGKLIGQVLLPSGQATVTSTSSVPPNQWSLVTLTYKDAVLNPGSINLSINGVSDSSMQTLVQRPLSRSLVRIGGFAAQIDEVGIWGRVLSPSEIWSIYYAGCSGICVPSPNILTQPASVAACPGSPVTFSVSVNGPGAVVGFQWRKNGIEINGATSSSYSISAVTTGDLGSYDCVVIGQGGNVTSSAATLTLKSSVTPIQELVSWWRAENNTIDAVGNNNGTLLNASGSDYTAGKVGSGFQFSSTHNCVSIPYSPTLVSSTYTIEAWIMPNTQVPQTTIFGPSSGHCRLLLRPGTAGGEKVVLAFSTASGSQEVVSASDIPLGQFSHVAGTWDGTKLSVYINGSLSAALQPIGTPINFGKTFFIGACYEPPGNVSEYFDGVIDEVSYYTRALSISEIQGIYHADCGGKTVPAPLVLTQPLPVTVCPGLPATFTVVANGGANLNYQWRKYGADLSDGPNISGTTSATLKINSVGAGDAATVSSGYDCLVSRPGAGSTISTRVSLTIGIPAAINPDQQPLDQSVCAGSTVSFTVGTSGTVSGYQWQQSLDGGISWLSAPGQSTAATYVIPSASTSAEYRVIVTGLCNDALLPSTAATLTVFPTNAAPSITTEPNSMCAQLSASFSVVASGQNLTYQWRKNGVNLTDDGRISGAKSPTLVINPVNGNDVATSADGYDCVVSGACGQPAISTRVGLGYGDTFFITQQPTSIQVCNGMTATFTVMAGPGPITFQWEQRPDSGSQFQNAPGASTSSTYVVPSVTTGSQFRVKATWICGYSKYSDIVSLDVIDSTLDSDKDGLPDCWEVFIFGSITVENDPTADRDFDGLTTLEEFKGGYDPRKLDTLGHGVGDGFEDADGDGLANLAEKSFGTDMFKFEDANGNGIPDWREDSDHDGLPDACEIFLGLDPNSVESPPSLPALDPLKIPIIP
jgi:hypothetical protein